MRSMGELMRELGFNKDAPEESQKAFIRHLIKAAAETNPPPEKPSDHCPDEPQQLSFDFDDSKSRAG